MLGSKLNCFQKCNLATPIMKVINGNKILVANIIKILTAKTLLLFGQDSVVSTCFWKLTNIRTLQNQNILSIYRVHYYFPVSGWDLLSVQTQQKKIIKTKQTSHRCSIHDLILCNCFIFIISIGTWWKITLLWLSNVDNIPWKSYWRYIWNWGKLFKFYCCRSQLTLKLLFNGPDKP